MATLDRVMAVYRPPYVRDLPSDADIQRWQREAQAGIDGPGAYVQRERPECHMCGTRQDLAEMDCGRYWQCGACIAAEMFGG